MVADLLLNRSKHGLKNLEAQRRAAAQAKLDATRLLWESYQAVLEAGHVEAAKVHRLVLGIAASHDLMARSMATTKKKKRSAASSGEDAATGASAEAKDVMQSLQASTDTVGELFAKSAYDLLGIDVKIKELVGDMRDGVQNLAGAEVHLASMEQAEEQVREAWDAYYTIVEARRAHTPRTPGKVEDQWLAELHYRTAVEQQEESWKTSLQVLDDLFTSCRSLECRRRINLREYLILASIEKKNAIRQVEGASTAALVDWIGKEAGQSEIEAQVAAEVQELSQELADDERVDRTEGRQEMVKFYVDLFNAESILQSGFVYLAAIVEQLKKDKHLLALIVVTVDSMLHFFELPESDAVTITDAPAKAFELFCSKNKEIKPTRTLDLHTTELATSTEDNIIELETESGEWFTLCAASPRDQIALINAMHAETTRVTL